MTVNIYQTTVQQIGNMGILSIFIPFLLIYSLVFILLESAGLFRKNDNDKKAKKLHALFAFGFSLMAIAHQNLIKWLIFLIPHATIYIIALFLFMMLIGLFGDKIPKSLQGFIILLSFITFVALATEGIALSNSTVSTVISSMQGILTDVISVAILLGMFLLFAAWLGRKTENGNDNG